MSEFRWPIRVYYEDTDAGGVVYHANYLNYYERARTEWLRAKGFEQDELRDEEKLIFAVRRVSIDYDLPARFNDELEVISNIEEIKTTRMYFQQQIFKTDGTRINTATVEVVAIHSELFKATRIPDHILQEIIDVD